MSEISEQSVVRINIRTFITVLASVVISAGCYYSIMSKLDRVIDWQTRIESQIADHENRLRQVERVNHKINP
jgi:hypothetical protein